MVRIIDPFEPDPMVQWFISIISLMVLYAIYHIIFKGGF
jgi:hypothetical protein